MFGNPASRAGRRAADQVPWIDIGGGATIRPRLLLTPTAASTRRIRVGDGPMQYYVNNAAHVLSPGTEYGFCRFAIYNGASAGAITKTGWTLTSGDSFDTTAGHWFVCSAEIWPYGSLLQVQAMQ